MHLAGQYLVGELPQPGQDGVVPPRVGVPDPEGFDQLDCFGVSLGRHGVLDRLVGRPVITMPGVGAAVQRRGQARLAPLELHPEQLRKDGGESGTTRPRRRAGRGTSCSVTARRASPPSPPAPSRHRTEGRSVVRESRYGASAPAPAGHAPRVPPSPGNPPRDGSTRQRCARKRGGRRRPAARAPRDRARPAIPPSSPPDFDVFGREVEPEAAVQECVRFLGGESQIVGS